MDRFKGDPLLLIVDEPDPDAFATEYRGEWQEIHGPTEDELKDWRSKPVPFEQIQRDIHAVAAGPDGRECDVCDPVVITQTRILPCNMEYIVLTVDLGETVKVAVDR